MKRIRAALALAIVLLGVSFLLYPTISNLVNERTQSIAIAEYEQSAHSLEENQRQKLLDDALSYNAELVEKYSRFTLSEEDMQKYNLVLDISQTGIMGYIKIPKIHVDLPIYHGIEEGTLQVAVGHIPGSSFPVGGPSTHCVLSGHSGLPSAYLFTDLDQLSLKDRFEITVLDETLIYEVDQIVTVLPQELNYLEIEAGEDLCTLVTCTPYGVNTHRLLVRGHRIYESDETETSLRENRNQNIFTLFPGILLLGGIAFLLFFIIYIHKKRSYKGKRIKNRHGREANKNERKNYK